MFVEFEKRNAGQKFRIVFLPYAGGSPWIFKEIAQQLPQGIHKIGCSLSSPMLKDVDAIAKNAASHSQDHLPAVVVGYSLGGLVGLHLTQYLPNCIGLIAIASRPPKLITKNIRDFYLDLSEASEETLIEELIRMGGVDMRLLKAREILQYALPQVRSDFRLLGTYDPNESCPPMITEPIDSIAGIKDKHVDSRSVKQWLHCTASEFTFTSVDAGHFFIKEKKELIAQVIQKAILRSLTRKIACHSEESQRIIS